MKIFSFFKNYSLIISLLVLATLIRLYNLDSISLWHDEAFSALLIKYPWGEMIHRIGLDVHPPMYYIFLRFWHYVFGDTVFALRAMSVFFGVGTVWASWMFVKTAFKSDTLAIWAALLIAVSPFQVQYVTEARMYTMGVFFAVLGAYFLVKALHEQKQHREDKLLNMPNMPEDLLLHKKYIWHYIGFALAAAVCALTHYYLLFTVTALGFYGLLYHVTHYRTRIKAYIPFIGSCILVLGAFLPWLKVFLFQYKQVQAGYWIEKMNIWSIPSTVWDMLFGFARDTHNPTTQKLLFVVTFFSIIFLIRFIRKTDFFEKWLVLFCILAPFAGSLLFVALARLKGSDSSVYLVRYFLFASPFYLIALATWLKQLRPRVIGVVLMTLLVLANGFAIYHYWSDLSAASRPGMRAAARFLGANAEPGQHIFLGTSFELFNYKYYNQTYYPTPEAPRLYTGGRSEVSQMSHVEGAAILANSDLAPDFTTGVVPGNTAWVIWTQAFGSRKPDVPTKWLELDEQVFPEIRPYVGANIYVTRYLVR